METKEIHLIGSLKSQSQGDTRWMNLIGRQRVGFYTKRAVGALSQGTHPKGVEALQR